MHRNDIRLTQVEMQRLLRSDARSKQIGVIPFWNAALQDRHHYHPHHIQRPALSFNVSLMDLR